MENWGNLSIISRQSQRPDQLTKENYILGFGMRFLVCELFANHKSLIACLLWLIFSRSFKNLKRVFRTASRQENLLNDVRAMTRLGSACIPLPSSIVIKFAAANPGQLNKGARNLLGQWVGMIILLALFPNYYLQLLRHATVPLTDLYEALPNLLSTTQPTDNFRNQPWRQNYHTSFEYMVEMGESREGLEEEGHRIRQ